MFYIILYNLEERQSLEPYKCLEKWSDILFNKYTTATDNEQWNADTRYCKCAYIFDQDRDKSLRNSYRRYSLSFSLETAAAAAVVITKNVIRPLIPQPSAVYLGY